MPPLRALYLCYFGLREPLVETQVLPYLRELARGGVAMTLLTFEPEAKRRWTAAAIAETRERLRADGIDWRMLPYHQRPSVPATLYDVLAGALRTAAIVRRERIDVIHARSHVAAAMGAIAKRLSGARLIFDIRGFLAEEYVDSGNWRAGGVLFRLTKAVERWLQQSADGVVVLTDRAKETLFPDGTRRPLEVIPCCIAEERFAAARNEDRDALRAELGLAGRTVYVYTGALGGYYLMHETAELLAVALARNPKAFALVLTQSRAAPIVAELARVGFPGDAVRVLQVPSDDVPRYLRASDVALALMRPSFARRAMSPTKFAEYLGAGLPVIATSGIGDLDAQIAEARVGVLLSALGRDAYVEAIAAIEELRRDPELAARCEREARLRYDLASVGAVRYRRLYDAVLGVVAGADDHGASLRERT